MNKAAQQLGKRGGQKTASLHGKKHFAEAGKKGMRSRWAWYYDRCQRWFPKSIRQDKHEEFVHTFHPS